MNRVLDIPLKKLSAYELVQNVEHGCRTIPASVTWGELGWPNDYHVQRCKRCRSCRALQRLERALLVLKSPARREENER